jgi:Uncharacterized protein conserved in bacteria (DUF2314).
MLLFGKSKREDSKALRSGTVEREPSRMFAIPADPGSIVDLEEVHGRLHDTDELRFGQTGQAPFTVTFKGEEFQFDTAEVDFSVDEDDPTLEVLSESELQTVLRAKNAVGVEMLYADNNMDSYHLQVKLLNMLVPDAAALFDTNGYRVHSGRWMRMTAGSKVAPSPDYMYVIHAVNDNEKGTDSVWLHTHGLTRCGTIELEILGADMNNWSDLGNSLNQIAHRLVGDNHFIDEMEPKLMGRTGDGRDIVVTWQRSEWSFKDFPKNIVGGKSDRNEEHSINMGVIYLYASEEDQMEGKITPIVRWADALSENAVFFKTTSESQRMRALAQERIEWLRRLDRELDDRQIIVKIGLKPDPDAGFDDGQFEYIWFEPSEFREDGFTATLTQDAFYVRGMVQGVQRECTYDEIVDWRVYTREESYSPDNIYKYMK